MGGKDFQKNLTINRKNSFSRTSSVERLSKISRKNSCSKFSNNDQEQYFDKELLDCTFTPKINNSFRRRNLEEFLVEQENFLIKTEYKKQTVNIILI